MCAMACLTEFNCSLGRSGSVLNKTQCDQSHCIASPNPTTLMLATIGTQNHQRKMRNVTLLSHRCKAQFMRVRPSALGEPDHPHMGAAHSMEVTS
jgi:hypothetical protein